MSSWIFVMLRCIINKSGWKYTCCCVSIVMFTIKRWVGTFLCHISPFQPRAPNLTPKGALCVRWDLDQVGPFIAPIAATFGCQKTIGMFWWVLIGPVCYLVGQSDFTIGRSFGEHVRGIKEGVITLLKSTCSFVYSKWQISTL